MNPRLRREDARAVDMILNHSAEAMAGQGSAHRTVFAAADPRLGERVVRAQKLLDLLGMLPGGEPAPDLDLRTLRFIEEAEQGHRPLRHTLPNLTNTQPHA